MENNETVVEQEAVPGKKLSFKDKILAYLKPEGVQKDMLRYKKHTLAYMLCFIAIICNCLGFCFIYSTITAVNIQTGIDILFNILFMLFCFLVAEKVKVYDINSSYYALLLGALEIGHLFWYPTVLFAEGSIENWVYVSNVILFIIAGASLIIAGVANLYRSTILAHYLKELAKTDASAALEIKEKK